ncbi:hypothetical protein [Pedobacter sp. SYSU D00535]|uniref:hypothetical protein n=1 Tax=Pedobacter sp. SYSU D00535 TaxID=2810308 RepID=UPI001A9751D2|nr:hypothetical protein [Pedobacter sp. SYSU D00535]
MEALDENKKLYERLLQTERENIAFLERLLKGVSEWKRFSPQVLNARGNGAGIAEGCF